jgi:hypothetical protein
MTLRINDSSYISDGYVNDSLVWHPINHYKDRYFKKLKRSIFDTLSIIPRITNYKLTCTYKSQKRIDSVITFIQNYIRDYIPKEDINSVQAANLLQQKYKGMAKGDRSGSLNLILPITRSEPLLQSLIEDYKLEFEAKRSYHYSHDAVDNLKKLKTISGEINEYPQMREYTYIDSLVLMSLYSNLNNLNRKIENERFKASHQELHIIFTKAKKKGKDQKKVNRKGLVQIIGLGTLLLSSLVTNVVLFAEKK